MICIYHSRDLDGFTSAAIVKRKYPDAILVGYDYGQDFPWDKIPKGEPVIMIDVSLPMADMELLHLHTGMQLTWIDHHISAIDEYNKYFGGVKTFINAVLQDGIAACEVGWKYLFPDEPMPTSVKLLGEYDTWRRSDEHRWENAILPFQFGMRQICNSPETFPTDLLIRDYGIVETDSPVYQIINNGKTILAYQAQINELLCRRAFEWKFEGLRAICLNAGGVNSETFKSVYDESKHDIMIPFFFNGKKWIFSMYTTRKDLDCALIAKARGGGGHRAACGWESDDIKTVFPFIK